MIWETATCVLLPFLGTAAGAAAVFCMKKELRSGLKKGLLGFASGVMLAALVWSLLMPAIELAERAGHLAWGPAVLGFLAGMGGLLWLDRLLSPLERAAEKRPGHLMMMLAVTIHNLPEGMAVGVALAGLLSGGGSVTAAGVMALAIGITVQNVPEGAIISAPLAADGMNKGKAFLGGVLSGAVEPLGALLTLGLTRLMGPILPYVLAFAAGTMLYVVVVELVPEMQSGEKDASGAVGTALGFALMMLLDVALG